MHNNQKIDLAIQSTRHHIVKHKKHIPYETLKYDYGFLLEVSAVTRIHERYQL